MVDFRSVGSKVLVLSLFGLFAGSAAAAGAPKYLSPTEDIGARHINMYNTFGPGTCMGCHSNTTNVMGAQFAPPYIGGMEGGKVDMGGSRACRTCHGNSLFIAKMPAYNRCEDCHDVSGGGGDGGWGGGGRGW